MDVAVIGGGISGLAAAWELRDKANVTVFEPGQLGGAIRTSLFGGKPVDEGADAFITRSPEAVELCTELGIESGLVAPSAGRSMLWWNGRLRPLPEGLALGVPVRVMSLLRSRILSPAGVARAGLDLVLPKRRLPEEPTVRELIASHLGLEVADRLVDPLVGGIHAGWTGRLAAKEVVPQLLSTAEQSRSLILGLRSTRINDTNGGPIFLTPLGGMGVLIEVLVDALRSSGVSFCPQAVESVGKAAERLVVKPALETFDGAVIAAPASSAARILGGVLSDITTPLANIPTASVALVTASFDGVRMPGGVNGFLVPRSAEWLMTACSFGSNKWPHWGTPGRTVIRMSAGRYGDDEAMRLSDDELILRLTEELGKALRQRAAPVETRISRWPDSFPQYLPGHARRIARVEELLERHFPAVALAGSSYRGVGIPSCIASGRRAARLLAERVGKTLC